VRKPVATPYAVLIGTGLLITLCGSANAAPVHRSKPRHVRGLSFHDAVPPPPFHYDDTRATTIRPSLAAARRYKNEATRSCFEFSFAFGGMADLLLARPGREYRPKQSRKSASVDRPDRAVYANMGRHKRPLRIVHLNQARPIGLENTFGASGVFCR